MAYLNGIDVSKWQRTTPPLTGLSFLFARASIGTTKDPMYDKHISAAVKAGLITGAYHFNWDIGASPEAQARFFVQTAGKVDLLFLDVEGRYAFDAMQSRRFIAEVHRLGRTIGLYHSRSGFADYGQDYNWIADYTIAARALNRPVTRTPWHFWQWTSQPWDRNYFNGNKDALYVLAGRQTAQPATIVKPVAGKTLAELRRLIGNLARVVRPTLAQRTKLAAYRKRLAEYLKRGR